MREPAFERLAFYQNVCRIRSLIYKIVSRFRNKHIKLAEQMRDAARSAKQNIREGYRRDSAGEFGRFIKISVASLSELEGDVDDCNEDRLIKPEEYNLLKNLLRRTNYQIDRYLDSLYRMQCERTWKRRFKRHVPKERS